MSSGDKLLSVLTLFSPERAALTVEQAAQELGLSNSTTYRYFASLAKAGLIDQAGEGRYIPGPAAIEMDWLIRRTDPLTLACGPAWRQLAVALDRPAVLLLCRLYRGQVMCVMQERVGFPQFGSGYERGRPMPLFNGAASKIILAQLTERVIAGLSKRSVNYEAACMLGGTPLLIRTALAPFRQAGICVTSGEIDEGLTGIAAPVFGPSGVLGSLACVLASDDLDAEAIERLSLEVKQAARRVSASLSSA